MLLTIKTIMNTQENNRLIAEFEGFETYEMNGYINVHYSDDNIRTIVDTHYHSSWDWLMPVVDKCYQEHMSKNIAEAVMTCDINKVYQVIVEFIKEYNSQKKL